MHDVVSADLEIRLHQPYYRLHQGDCEHFVVFDQIRYDRPFPHCLLSDEVLL